MCRDAGRDATSVLLGEKSGERWAALRVVVKCVARMWPGDGSEKQWPSL